MTDEVERTYREFAHAVETGKPLTKLERELLPGYLAHRSIVDAAKKGVIGSIVGILSHAFRPSGIADWANGPVWAERFKKFKAYVASNNPAHAKIGKDIGFSGVSKLSFLDLLRYPKSGRPRGAVYQNSDRPLIAEIMQIPLGGGRKAKAMELAYKADGGGTPESKAKRLMRGTRPPQGE